MARTKRKSGRKKSKMKTDMLLNVRDHLIKLLEDREKTNKNLEKEIKRMKSELDWWYNKFLEECLKPE